MNWKTCITVGAFAAALAAPAFAEKTAATPAPSAQAQAGATAAASQQGAYTDAQIEAFAKASAEIAPIQASANGAEMSAAQIEQIRAVLTRHQLDGETYNAIARQARTDATLAARIASATQAESRTSME